MPSDLLDGTYDLYDQPMRLAFIQWLRTELKFEGLEPLRAQIADDCVRARALFDQMTL